MRTGPSSSSGFTSCSVPRAAHLTSTGDFLHRTPGLQHHETNDHELDASSRHSSLLRRLLCGGKAHRITIRRHGLRANPADGMALLDYRTGISGCRLFEPGGIPATPRSNICRDQHYYHDSALPTPTVTCRIRASHASSQQWPLIFYGGTPK